MIIGSAPAGEEDDLGQTRMTTRDESPRHYSATPMAESLKKVVQPSFELEASDQNQAQELQLEELEKIRSILFGHQVAALEARIETIQNELTNLLESKVDDVNSKLTKTRKDLTRSRKELDEIIEERKKESDGELDLVRNKIEDLNASLLSDISQVRDDLVASDGDLEKQIASVEKSLGERIQEVSSELGGDKAGRAQLADLLEHMASQLRQQ